MPIRGETVGTAYIRILADGNGLDESIRSEMEDSDPIIRGMGRRGSKEYAKGWEKQFKDRVTRDQMRQGIADAVARGDYLRKEFFAGSNWKSFRKELETRFGEVGKRAGQNLQNELAEGMSFAELRNRLTNITAEIAKATRQMNREATQNLQDIDRANTRHITRLHRLFRVYETDVERIIKGERISNTSKHQMIQNLVNLRKYMTSAGGATHEFLTKINDMEDRLRNANPQLVRSRALIDKFATAMGTASGRGSRNNFLNFIGSMVRNIINLGQVIPAVIDGISDFGQKLSKTFNKAVEDGASGIAASFITLGAAAATLGPVLIGAAVAMGAIVLVAGPIVATLGALLGAVTALASTITFGLIGAVTVLGGALGALALGAGVGVAAFLSMDKTLRTKLMASLHGLRDALFEVGRGAAAEFIPRLTTDFGRLGGVVRGLGPIFRGVGSALGDIADHITDALTGPGFTAFSRELGVYLPGIVRSLGISISNALGGLGGIFRAALPYVEDFGNWLEDLTGRFARFANSPRGQRQIQDFFDKALSSARSLGRFIQALGGLLVAAFGPSQKIGDGLFDGLTSSVQDLTDYLTQHPGAVSKWFGDAQTLVSDIGDLVVNILKIADALDTASSRAQASWIFRSMGFAAQVIAFQMKTNQTAIEGIGTALGKVGGVAARFGSTFASGISMAIHGLAGLGSNIGSIIFGHKLDLPPGFFSAIRGAGGKIVGFFTGIPGRLRKIFNGMPRSAGPGRALLISSFSGVTSKIAAKFVGVPGRVRGILNRLGGIGRSAASLASSAFRSVTGKISSFFSGVPGRVRGILSRLGGVGQAAKNQVANAFNGVVSRIASHFSGVAGAVRGRLNAIGGAARSAASSAVSAFSGLGGRILRAIGSITIHPHISMPHIPGLAAGGIEEGIRGLGVLRRIGEAGPEAVVPLNRPLSQVDPAVRALSAFAQGKIQGMASGGVAGGGRTVNVDLNVYTPNTDTMAVAAEVVNRLAAVAY